MDLTSQLEFDSPLSNHAGQPVVPLQEGGVAPRGRSLALQVPATWSHAGGNMGQRGRWSGVTIFQARETGEI